MTTEKESFVTTAASTGQGDTRRTAWDTVRAAIGAVMGLAPHVLHHVGFLAGAAFLTGWLGNGLFFLVGLAFSVPLLRRLQRRFRSWLAPALAVLVFAGAYSLSAFVIGPSISGQGAGGQDTGPAVPSVPPSPGTTPDGHATHH